MYDMLKFGKCHLTIHRIKGSRLGTLHRTQARVKRAKISICDRFRLD